MVVSHGPVISHTCESDCCTNTGSGDPCTAVPLPPVWPLPPRQQPPSTSPSLALPTQTDAVAWCSSCCCWCSRKKAATCGSDTSTFLHCFTLDRTHLLRLAVVSLEDAYRGSHSTIAPKSLRCRIHLTKAFKNRVPLACYAYSGEYGRGDINNNAVPRLSENVRSQSGTEKVADALQMCHQNLEAMRSLQ